MIWNEWIEKNVVIELKKGSKYFGIVKEVADVGDGITFITLFDDKTKTFQCFASGEIARIEVKI